MARGFQVAESSEDSRWFAVAEDGSSEDLAVPEEERGLLRHTSTDMWKALRSPLAAGFVGTALLVAAARATVFAPRPDSARSTVVVLDESKDDAITSMMKCRAPAKGSKCYRDIEYASDHIKSHPDWYVGLHPGSSFKQVQNFLHKQRDGDGIPRCPPPCGYTGKQDAGHYALYSGKCHTAMEGEECFNHIIYTQKENLPKHPEWYPGLAEDASFKVVQDYLHQEGVCPAPCGLKAERKRVESAADKKLRLQEEKHHCHTAVAGEACYGDILWAKSHLARHIEWYKGLNVNSSFDEIQAFLHKQHNSDPSKLCPKPCNVTANSILKHVNIESCHTAAPGVSCYKSVIWVIAEGIDKHPEWYPNLTRASSTFEEVQQVLVKNKDKHCRRDPCPCETAQDGDDCWKAVSWVMKVGITNHSEWYEGLNENSTLEEVQARLHEDKHPLCRLPCARTPWLRYDKHGKAVSVPIDVNGKEIDEWPRSDKAEP